MIYGRYTTDNTSVYRYLYRFIIGTPDPDPSVPSGLGWYRYLWRWRM